MSVPWDNITAGAVVGSLLLNWARDGWSRWSVVGFFFVFWAVGLVLWGIWAVWVYPLLLSPLRHLPQPSNNHWLFGQGKRILREPSGIPMREWVNEIPNPGIIRYRGLFNQERILVCSPKALAEVLVTNNYAFEKPSHIKWTIGRILGIGVLLAEGDEHRVQRRNLTPAFAFRHIKDLYPIFWRKSREVTQAMTAELGGRELSETEVSSWASRATLDIIGVAGMGRDFGAIQDENSLLVKTYRKVFKPSKQAQILTVLGMFIPTWIISALPLRRNEDINKAASEIRGVCRDLIQEKKKKLANKEQPDVDILSVALESGGFSDESLVDQLMTFLAAGHETTASAMTWAIYMLSRYPEMQSRLREEVRQRLPSVDSDADISSLDIDHMPYLNAVCSEVLRYYSPVPLTIREAAHDTTILGYAVRKGTLVMLVPWATNFDRSLWGADAGSFSPERWLAEDNGHNEHTAAKKGAPASGGGGGGGGGGASSNYAFLTFLHGPRSCIGSSFARAEFACLLAAWIGRFEFALRDAEDAEEKNVVIKGGVTARPAKGMHVTVKVVGGF